MKFCLGWVAVGIMCVAVGAMMVGGTVRSGRAELSGSIGSHSHALKPQTETGQAMSDAFSSTLEGSLEGEPGATAVMFMLFVVGAAIAWFVIDSPPGSG